jgi:glycosyltransferase involved in cell wall biosynthesis
MHIAYIVQQFPPEIGAGPARAFELSQRWLAAGASVTAMTAMPSRMVVGTRAGTVAPEYRGRVFAREDHHGIDVLRSWCFNSPRGGILRTLANNSTFMVSALAHGVLRLGHPDVIIASSPPFLPHVTGRLLAAARRVPLVLELRDLWPDYLVGMGVLSRGSAAARGLFRLERALLLAADVVVVVTDAFARIVAEKGVPSDRIVVLPNGVDLNSYYALPQSSVPERRGEFTVGYLGNFGAGQDLSIAVRAAALLQDEGIRFVLIGDGPDRARIERLVRDSGLSNIVVRDSIAKAETLGCYHAFDICLVPLAPIAEFQDTIPSKIFEIMACERPVLASAEGETRQLIERSGAGLAVPAGDDQAVAAGIRQLRALSRAQLRELGARGRAYVATHYSRDDLAHRYLKLLTAVVGADRKGRRSTGLGREQR